MTSGRHTRTGPGAPGAWSLGVALLLAGVCVAPTSARGQAAEPAEVGAENPRPDPEAPPIPKGLPELIVDCSGAELFGGSELEKAGFCAGRQERYVDARTFADRLLDGAPTSFRAHYVMGYAQHLGEANLPKALHHLERAEALFVAEHGRTPDRERSPWYVYYRILQELAYIHGEMDHHEAKIAYVDRLYEGLQMDLRALKAWPLMKLERFDEARAVARAAAESEDSWDRAVGLTALCAVESELRRRDEAYEACMAAARPMLKRPGDGAVELSNAAQTAEEMMKFAEAERYYLEASRRPPEGSVNPWGRLVKLYVRQGRFPEALSAWRQMRAYRASRAGAHMDQQDQSEAELIGATVLLVAGRPEPAARITRRTVRRPDRQGTSSAASDQNEGGAAILDRVAQLTYARLLEADASTAPFLEGLELRLKALRLRYQAWQSGRRAAEILANPVRLHTTLRPEVPGSLEQPSWLDPEVLHLVGPGVALAALETARAEETLPEALSEPIFGALEAEARLLAGDAAAALEGAERVLGLLPPSEAMHRARLAAVGAQAAWALDEYDTVKALLREVLAKDPQAMLRMGLRLPVRLAAIGSDPAVTEALDLLEGSPRLALVDWGFVLSVGRDEARLETADGTALTTMRMPEILDADADAEAAGRRLARAVHRELLVPALDVTQADIRSLDGALGPGEKATRQVDQMLEEIEEAP